VIASHSSARALANVARNMTDSMIKAVAHNGGAVCVNFFPVFLDEKFYLAAKPLMARTQGMSFLEAEKFLRAEERKLPPVPLSRLIDHIDHIAKVGGVDHVCLGSDFDGIDSTPAGMEDVSHLPAITTELRKRGYQPEEIEKILGGNTLRVLEANEPTSPPRRNRPRRGRRAPGRSRRTRRAPASGRESSWRRSR